MHKFKSLVLLTGLIASLLSSCGGDSSGENRANALEERLRKEIKDLSHRAEQSEKEKRELTLETERLTSDLSQSSESYRRLSSELTSLQQETEKLQQESSDKEVLNQEIVGLKHDLGVEKQLNMSLRTAHEQNRVELQAELQGLKDPLEMFKKNSLLYIENLQPKDLFGGRSLDHVDTFQKKLRYLSDPVHLLKDPMPQSKPLTLPLPLIFDEAPKSGVPFVLFISSMQGDFEAEQSAKFLLATDDQTQFAKVEHYQFKVPVGFPVIYLGRGTFMLPKTLFDPLYASDDSAKFIPLEYDFENNDDLPRGYEHYLRNLAAHSASIDGAKSLATDARQREIDAKSRPTTSP